jgi:hypothetical protein
MLGGDFCCFFNLFRKKLRREQGTITEQNAVFSWEGSEQTRELMDTADPLTM